MKQVFLVSGLKSSGKDTTCEILADLLPSDDTYSIAYAYKIKKIVSIIFDVDYEILEGRTPEARAKREELVPFWSDHIEGLTLRKALTGIGTDLFRDNYLDEIWSFSTINSIIQNNKKYSIVTDLREPEAEEKTARELLPKEGFSVVSIRVDRHQDVWWWDTAINAYFYDDEQSRQVLHDNGIHRSEWMQVGLNPDFMISNKSMDSLDDAYENIRKQLIGILNKTSL